MLPETASALPGHAAADAILCPVTDLALAGVAGPDASAFLQGQLSSDVGALAVGAAQWSSYNSPKGRVLATVLLWREGEDAYRLLLAADLAEATIRRLRMFVLRAKVTLDLAAATPLHGLAGAGAAAVLRSVAADVPPAGGTAPVAGGTLLATPDGRFLLLGAGAAALPAALTRGDAEEWRYRRIVAGVPLVTAATADQFVPQTINWDVLGGISFRKGCYPGQEIVARTHYLGRLKERLHAYRAPHGDCLPGTRLYSPAFGEQACGTVVNAARHPAGGQALLAVIQSAAAAGPVRSGAPDGAELEALALPYAIPDPAPPRGRSA